MMSQAAVHVYIMMRIIPFAPQTSFTILRNRFSMSAFLSLGPLAKFGSDDVVPWVPETDYRTTWDIVVTCLSTLTICAWSAVHLDIPTTKSKGRKLLARICWTVVRILCPVIMLNHAVSQLHTSMSLCQFAREYISPHPEKALANSWLRHIQLRLKRIYGNSAQVCQYIPSGTHMLIFLLFE